MKKAFTLMEVLVVIAVLAILIGIAVPRIKGFQEQAKKQKAQSGLKILQNAVEAYYMRHSEYPPQTDTLSADYLMSEASPKIDEVLYDPFGDGTQEYNYLVDGNYWAVSSRGLDGTLNVPIFSSNRLLIAAGVDDLAQTNGIVATCAEGGYTDCGGSCNDLQTDADNCGSCGAAGGPDCCVGLPVDLQIDDANCGSCGDPCGDEETCTAGSCATPDPCEGLVVGDPAPGGGVCAGTWNDYKYMAAAANSSGTWIDCASCPGPEGCYDAVEEGNWVCDKTNATDENYGKTNIDTLKTFSGDLTDYPAAKVCYDSREGGYDDWYLPAKNELHNVLFLQSNCKSGNTACDDEGEVIDGFEPSRYWSSTVPPDEFNFWGYVWVKYFSSGIQTAIQGSNQSSTSSVRCVRRYE